MTGRVQPLWTHSSREDGDPSNEFLLRRARLSMKVKINDWVSGFVEPDFGEGKAVLKDAYFTFEPVADRLEFLVGQTKRRFDLFDLKGLLEGLAARIGLDKTAAFSYSPMKGLTGGTLAVEFLGASIGQLGSVSEETLKSFGIDQPVFVFEVDLPALAVR